MKCRFCLFITETCFTKLIWPDIFIFRKHKDKWIIVFWIIYTPVKSVDSFLFINAIFRKCSMMSKIKYLEIKLHNSENVSVSVYCTNFKYVTHFHEINVNDSIIMSIFQAVLCKTKLKSLKSPFYVV